jgi:hypothetical protein
LCDVLDSHCKLPIKDRDGLGNAVCHCLGVV